MSNTDALFRLLAHETRRQLLTQLLVTDSLRIPADLRTRGGVATSRESERLVVRPTDQTLAIQLQQKHLPKLESAGVITWDRDEQFVTRGPDFDSIEPALRVLTENADKLPGGWP